MKKSGKVVGLLMLCCYGALSASACTDQMATANWFFRTPQGGATTDDEEEEEQKQQEQKQQEEQQDTQKN